MKCIRATDAHGQQILPFHISTAIVFPRLSLDAAHVTRGTRTWREGAPLNYNDRGPDFRVPLVPPPLRIWENYPKFRCSWRDLKLISNLSLPLSTTIPQITWNHIFPKFLTL